MDKFEVASTRFHIWHVGEHFSKHRPEVLRITTLRRLHKFRLIRSGTRAQLNPNAVTMACPKSENDKKSAN